LEVWEAVVFGFAGLRLKDGKVLFTPRFPAHWKRVAFWVTVRGEQRWVELRNPEKP